MLQFDELGHLKPHGITEMTLPDFELFFVENLDKQLPGWNGILIPIHRSIAARIIQGSPMSLTAAIFGKRFLGRQRLLATTSHCQKALFK